MDAEHALPRNTALPKLRRSEMQLRAPYVRPGSDLEIRIAGLWSDILNIDEIGTQDDYFDLGGDSLMATNLFLEIEQAFGVQLPTSEVLEHPTVEKLAALLARHTKGEEYRCLLALQAEGIGPPLFLLHDMSGGLMSYRHMLRRLGTGRKIFGVQYPGAIEGATEVMSLPQMCAIYASAIREAWPQGPYYLAGYSLGARIAFETANQIAAAGGEVRLLALLDGSAGSQRIGGLRRLAHNIAHSLFELANLEVGRWPAHALGGIGRDLRRGRTRKQRRQSPRDFKYLIMAQSAAYLPALYPHAAKVLRGSEYFSGKYLGWDKYVSGPLEVFDISGSHDTIMNEPRVALVAACLENWVREADSLETGPR
jgi:thioesterase domain-containing protein/acyl carrier protein